jgi:uracil-DNA glycosylase family 4
MTDDRTRAARELLAFYLEAGVESLIGEQPVDRLSEPAREPEPAPAAAATTIAAEPPRRTLPPRGPVAPEPPRTPAPVAPEVAVMAAREAARSAESLEALRAIMAGFEGCALRTMAKQLVFADGNPQARVMFVGEAPGREEDIEGLPFVGRSGQLLDRMLAAIGLDRTSAYITNIIPWRPPGNRDPTPQETIVCLPFIRRHIELVDPDVLVCLGKPSMNALLELNEGIRRMRGKWLPYRTGRREIRALPTYHPAFLLRSPLEKRQAWRDLLAIKRALAESAG